MTDAVLAQGMAAEHWTDAQLAELAGLAGGENLDWWIGHLREAETSIRRCRKRLEALREGVTSRVCPECGGPVTGRADAKYCGSTCRVRAHRARSQPHDGTAG
jgi:hypothetical protein